MPKIDFYRKNFTFKNAADLTSEVYQIDNGGPYKMRRPYLYNAPGYIANDVDAYLKEDVVRPPSGVLAVLSNALVRQPGFVFVENSIVTESVYNLIGNTNLEDWMPVLKQPGGGYAAKPEHFHISEIVDEETVCLVQNADINYGHWIIEALPRLALVAKKRSLKDLRFLISRYHNDVKSFQVESLKLLGISKDQIIFLGGEPILFRELLYPAPLTSQPYVKAPIVLRFLRDMAVSSELARVAPGPKRLFVSRNKWGKRALLNEAAVIEHLNTLGFETVHPEELSLVEQIAKFRDAEIVVGSLGGSLSNLVFSPDGVDLVALTTQYMNDDFFWDIISQKGGEYHSIHGDATNPELGMQSDYNIDIELFKKVLVGAILRRRQA